MNGQDHPWWCHDDYPGKAAPLTAAAGDDEFLHIDDLLGLAWEGGMGAPSCARSSPPALEPPLVSPPEPPPSQDVMAAWLYPIVSGGDRPTVKSEPSTMAMGSFGMTESKLKLPARDGMYHVKKRRCRISDKLRTLQQLVPGCQHTDQVSMLEQTIQYMKSLQQQVQAMNMRPTQAVYPVMQTALAPAAAMPMAAGGHVPLLPAGMAPFGAMLPCPHYHAVMVPEPAAAAPLYRPQPAALAAPEGQCSVTTEQHCNKERGRRRRL
ncbi:hypothetical protein VPH35_074886 [Triticum aestivum]